MNEQTLRTALLIDADNTSARQLDRVIGRLTDGGAVIVKRVYGNFTKPNLAPWLDAATGAGLKTVQCNDVTKGKNASDMYLTIDAMDMLHGEAVDRVALMSSDSDFTPLAMRLREGGVQVVGVGSQLTPVAFRVSCDEFWDLDTAWPNEMPVQTPQVRPEASGQPMGTPRPRRRDRRAGRVQRVHAELARACKRAVGGWCTVQSAGKALHAAKLPFTVQDLGFASLRAFVAEHPDVYELRGHAFRRAPWAG